MGRVIHVVILSVALGLGVGAAIVLTPAAPANAGCSTC